MTQMYATTCMLIFSMYKYILRAFKLDKYSASEAYI